MAFAHHRTRVERLLYGDFHTEDLTKLFLHVRMETQTQTVKELGHFIAHSDERVSGVTTDMAKEFFAIMRFWWAAMTPTGMQLNWQNLPPDFITYLQANFKSLNRKIIFEQTGLKQREAIKAFEEVIPKFSRYANGRYYLFSRLPAIEEKLVRCLLSSMNTRPAFTANRLYNEFSNDLVRLGHLRTEELPRFKKIKPALSLFAIATMHGCRVILDDGSEARLYITEGVSGLEVTARANAPTLNLPNLQTAGVMFITTLPAKIWCGEPLRKLLQPNSHPYPMEEIAIELRDTQKLEAILPPSSFLPPAPAISPLQPRTQNSLRLYAGLSLASLRFLLVEGFRRVIERLRR